MAFHPLWYPLYNYNVRNNWVLTVFIYSLNIEKLERLEILYSEHESH